MCMDINTIIHMSFHVHHHTHQQSDSNRRPRFLLQLQDSDYVDQDPTKFIYQIFNLTFTIDWLRFEIYWKIWLTDRVSGESTKIRNAYTIVNRRHAFCSRRGVLVLIISIHSFELKKKLDVYNIYILNLNPRTRYRQKSWSYRNIKHGESLQRLERVFCDVLPLVAFLH